MVHRDTKLDNAIIVSMPDGTFQIKVSDVDTAVKVNTPIYRTVGTPDSSHITSVTGFIYDWMMKNGPALLKNPENGWTKELLEKELAEARICKGEVAGYELDQYGIGSSL